jgi:hypothetical protein
LAGKELIAEQISLAIVRGMALDAVSDSSCQVFSAGHGLRWRGRNNFGLRSKRSDA